MVLLCSVEKPDNAAHVPVPILLQRRYIFLFDNSVRAMVAIKYLANAVLFNWQLISIAKNEGPPHEKLGWRWST